MLVPILISVSAVSALVLLGLMVALIRHLRVLAEAVQRLEREVTPLAEQLRTEAEQVRARVDRLSERQTELRRAGEPRGARR
jgi:uncharacterized membrane protein